MEEGKLIADFISANLSKAIEIASKGVKKVDEKIKLKIKHSFNTYLENSLNRHSKSKSFFIRNKSVPFYDYYVPIPIKCEESLFDVPSIGKILKHSNRCIITGIGGTGKSVLMKHLFLDCINTQSFVPVFVELRDLNINSGKLEEYVKLSLSTSGFYDDDNFIVECMKSGQFCFILDGFDEVNADERLSIFSEIKAISNSYPSCPIVISARPEKFLTSLDEFEILDIQQMSLECAIQLITKLPYEEKVKNRFLKELKDHLYNEHQSFLSNPLLLSIMLLTYSENAEIPSKLSLFYYQAYEALFQKHDANKGGYVRDKETQLDIQDFAKIFSLISLQTYEKRKFGLNRVQWLSTIEKAKIKTGLEFKKEKFLNDALGAACLLIEDGLEITFSHRSFQEYFVSLYLSTASPEIQEKLLNRYADYSHVDSVFRLLLEINPEPVERYIFLPYLEECIKTSGIKKRPNTKMALSFLQNSVSNLLFSSGGLMGWQSRAETGDTMKNVVLMAIENHRGLRDFYSWSGGGKFGQQYWIKHEKESDRLHFSTLNVSGLTINSKLLKELYKDSKGSMCSKEFLIAIYDAHKFYSEKFSTEISDIDELLGI